MRSIGLRAIIIGLVIYILSFIAGITVEINNTRQLMYISWSVGFSQLLVFAGIGFILYDIAARHGIKEFPKTREKPKEEPMDAKEAVMDCPNCKQKTKFPYSMIGTIVECPNCKTKVTIEGVQGKSGNKEEFRWD
jgi:ribosomal protein L37AE/L43A